MAKKRGKVSRKAPPAHTSRRSKTNLEQFGHYAFFVGLLIAVLFGLIKNLISGLVIDQVVIVLLVLLGLIIGLLNITMKETTPFLVASIALMFAGVVRYDQILPVFGFTVRAILSNIVLLVVPAAVFVALRAVWVLANKR